MKHKFLTNVPVGAHQDLKIFFYESTRKKWGEMFVTVKCEMPELDISPRS